MEKVSISYGVFASYKPLAENDNHIFIIRSTETF